MKALKISLFVIMAFIFFAGKTLLAQSPDWKLCGYIPDENEKVKYAFYDNANVKRLSNGNLRVIQKFMSPSEIEAIRKAHRDDIMDKERPRLRANYTPPFTKFFLKFYKGPKTREQIAAFELSSLILEVTADCQDDESATKGPIELNCKQRKMRSSGAPGEPWKNFKADSTYACICKIISQ